MVRRIADSDAGNPIKRPFSTLWPVGIGDSWPEAMSPGYRLQGGPGPHSTGMNTPSVRSRSAVSSGSKKSSTDPASFKARNDSKVGETQSFSGVSPTGGLDFSAERKLDGSAVEVSRQWDQG